MKLDWYEPDLKTPTNFSLQSELSPSGLGETKVEVKKEREKMYKGRAYTLKEIKMFEAEWDHPESLENTCWILCLHFVL